MASVPVDPLAVVPRGARSAVAVGDVSQAPLDLGGRVGPPVRACRGHLGARQRLGDSVRPRARVGHPIVPVALPGPEQGEAGELSRGPAAIRDHQPGQGLGVALRLAGGPVESGLPRRLVTGGLGLRHGDEHTAGVLGGLADPLHLLLLDQLLAQRLLDTVLGQRHRCGLQTGRRGQRRGHRVGNGRRGAEQALVQCLRSLGGHGAEHGQGEHSALGQPTGGGGPGRLLGLAPLPQLPS